MARQPRERICTQQINDHFVPSVRGTHEIVGMREAHVHEGGCRVDPSPLLLPLPSPSPTPHTHTTSTQPPPQHREADWFANGDHQKLKPQKRVSVDLARLQWVPEVLGPWESSGRGCEKMTRICNSAAEERETSLEEA